MVFNSESRIAIPARATPSPGFGLSVIKRFLSCLESGKLVVVTPSGERIEQQAENPGFEAVVVLHRWRALRRLAFGGDLGFAEAYIDGDWSSPDLTALVSLAAKNISHIDSMISSLRPIRFLARVRHLLKLNTKAGSRRNIAFHYDLGNDFYRLWLDASMTYSSALYRDRADSLEAAQNLKLQRIVDLLDLRQGEHVLEIGCGWGALATRLARENARVTALTLSSEQHTYTRNVVAAEGLDDAVDARIQDYRDVEGRYDKIVSIEMLEAVGETYWPAYFETLRRRLKPGGKAVLQAITIHEDRFESYRRAPDFIQRYVFPGGMLPTKAIIETQAKRAGLDLVSAEWFGESYRMTLAEWRRRFLAALPAVEKLGFNASFGRLWEYYLCYCEAGFGTGMIDVGLYTFKS